MGSALLALPSVHLSTTWHFSMHQGEISVILVNSMILTVHILLKTNLNAVEYKMTMTMTFGISIFTHFLLFTA